MPAWVLVAAASIAAAAGVGAVALASPLLAVVGGTASAVTALLALDGRLARDRAASAEAAEGIQDLEALLAGAEDDEEPADDPMRALFEAGPAIDGPALLDEHFVATTLRGRVAVARRSLRPLSLVCFEAIETEGGRLTVPVATADIAQVLRRTLREADVAGRGGEGTYVCILEDTGEDGAVWTAERVRRNLVEAGQVRRFRAGVAAYPTHGLEADELEAKARAALVAARDWSTDRIEVATP
ncbi:MAG TPA: hypothetical protein VFV42_08110 [Acidimicrobiales bacterium]|nr:hypothetical protein [Acidimicrobiales bacterium]